MSDVRLQILGQNIRQMRKELGFSQESLADKAKLDRSYMGRVERGEKNITVLKLYQVCDALGISPKQLF